MDDQSWRGGQAQRFPTPKIGWLSPPKRSCVPVGSHESIVGTPLMIKCYDVETHWMRLITVTMLGVVRDLLYPSK